MTTRKMTNLKLITVSFLLFSLTCLRVSAQDNVLKLDILNSVMGNYSLSYERVVNEKQSFNLNVAVMPEKDLFSFADDAFDVDSEFENRLSGFSVSPEYRFYFGKNRRKSPRGFYMAPYCRVSDYKMLLHDTFEDHDTQIDGSLFTTGIGLQLGAHWIFSDVFSLDWQFMGIGVDRHSLRLDYASNEEGVDFQRYGESVEENNEDIFILGSKIETEYGEDYIKSTAKALFPGVRGKLTLGIAF